MLILSSQDLFFSALSKRLLCNAHLALPRPASKRIGNKWLLLLQNILLARVPLVLRLPWLALFCCGAERGRTGLQHQCLHTECGLFGTATKLLFAIFQLQNGYISTQRKVGKKSVRYQRGNGLNPARQRGWDGVQLFAAPLCPSNWFLMGGCSWETIWLLHLPPSLSCNTWYTEAMTI